MRTRRSKEKLPKPPKPVQPTEIVEGSTVTCKFNGVMYRGLIGELVSPDAGEDKLCLRAISPLNGCLVQRYEWDDDGEELELTGPEFFVPLAHLKLHEDSPQMEEYYAKLDEYYEEYGYDED